MAVLETRRDHKRPRRKGTRVRFKLAVESDDVKPTKVAVSVIGLILVVLTLLGMTQIPPGRLAAMLSGG